MLALDSHPNSHTFGECKITFDQIQVVDKSDKQRPIYGIKARTESYSEFIKTYVTELKRYMIHHYKYIWQHTQKLTLLATLPQNSILTRWDFINNPKVKHYFKTNNQWGEIAKFSLRYVWMIGWLNALIIQ